MTFSLNPIVRAINAPLMLWNAYPIALRAWRIWRRESRLNVDFLDTLAITASVAQNHHTAGALITWLVKLGDWFRDLTMAGSKRAIGDLLEFQSKTAWIKIDGLVVSVPARALKVGDEVVVYPGEVIPVDGEITRWKRVHRSENHYWRRTPRNARPWRGGFRRDCYPRWSTRH